MLLWLKIGQGNNNIAFIRFSITRAENNTMNTTKKNIIEVVKSCEIAFLSTVNLDNFPETRALDNTLNKGIDDELKIYFTCGTDSPKVKQLKKNNSASLYYYAPGNYKNMILFGKLELVADNLLKDKLWRDEFLRYYKNGKNDEQYGILKFIPTGYKYYSYGAGGLNCPPQVGQI
jgi:general stress protein 26